MKDFFEIVIVLINFFFKLIFGVVVIVGMLVGYGIAVEPGQLSLTEVRIESKQWPTLTPALRIAVISDLHVGAPHIDIAKLENIVETVNSWKPDLVVLLGDFMPENYFRTGIPPAEFVPVLGRFSARYGIVTVLGERDWGVGSKALRDALARARITVLHNQAIPLKLPKGKRVWIVGLADPASPDKPNYGRAARKVPKKEPVIALAHNPSAISGIPFTASAILAGHSLGGLVNVPEYGVLLMPVDMPKRFMHGLFLEDEKKIFVTSGIGTAAYPIRLNNPPEIALVTVAPLK